MYISSLPLALLAIVAKTIVASDPTNVTTIDLRVDLHRPDTSLAEGNADILNDREEHATRRVSYFIEDDLAIIDGDIILTALHALPNKRNKRGLSLLTTQKNELWPNGFIPYKWSSQDGKDYLEPLFLNATRRWTKMLPFLVFNDTGVIDATLDPDVLTLNVTDWGTCSSPVGKANETDHNVLKLSKTCRTGTMTHEIGHALGLYHEHMRPDRDSYVKVNCENVKDDAGGVTPDCGKDCKGLGCNFQKLSADEADWSGPYDSQSVMHYLQYGFSKNMKPTIEMLPGVPPTPPNEWPTALDARKVCDLYREQCKGVCGDGVLAPENGEECDDGNNVNGDGCSADCKKEGGEIPSPTPTPIPQDPAPTPSPTSQDPSNPSPAPEDPSNTPLPPQDPQTPQEPPTSPCSIPTCDPQTASSCDITTSCIPLEGASHGGKYLCACRHGFRASGVDAADHTLQVRLPWKTQAGRVFVKPGTQCNQLCDGWLLGRSECLEVKESEMCY